MSKDTISRVVTGGEVEYSIVVKIEELTADITKGVLNNALKGLEARHKQSGMNHLVNSESKFEYVAETAEEYAMEKRETGRSSFLVTLKCW